jgi:signal transduction histidine kinase
MPQFHWVVPLVAAIACLAVGIAVRRLGPRSEVSNVFGFLTINLFLWNLIFVSLYAIPEKELAFVVSRPLRVGAIFVPPAIFHLSVAIGNRRSRRVFVVLCADYAVAAILVVLNAADLIVSDLHTYSWGFYSVGTRVYNLYTIFVLVNFVSAGTILVGEFRSAEPNTRLKLKFWLFGLVVALPLGLTNLLPAYGIPIYPLGNLGSAVWAAIVAYAIVRHRLMDIDVVLTKSIAYTGVAIIVLAPTFVALMEMERLEFGLASYGFSATVLFLLVIVSLLFPPLRARAEMSLARGLFREKYEGRTALTNFAHAVVRILDREKLIGEFCDTLVGVFRLRRIALFLREGLRGGFELQRSFGASPSTTSYPSEHPLVRWLAGRGEPVLRGEALDEPGEQGENVRSAFESDGWEVMVPLISGNYLIGFVALGTRQDRQAFGAKDLSILTNVGIEASIAFENARLYAEVRRSQEIINRAGRLSALGTLAAGIAHEIRNPLVSIQTFFQLAPERLNDEEFMTSFLRLAEAEVQRITSLINELLTFSKSGAANVREIDLREVVERTITLITPQARSQRIELTHIPLSVDAYVVMDPDQILQVLLNIVLNAIQATPVRGAVTVEIRRIANDRGEFWQIEIRDTGPGIPDHLREAIFNPFFTTKDKGTGLGLAIAHRIVAENGGFIVLESREGAGSRFLINLPIAEGGSADADLEEKRAWSL